MKDTGIAVLNEWVFLLGGLDQGIALPSLSWLVGVRTANGTEFGAGPNLGPTGVSLALAAGATVRAGFMNIPLNVAIGAVESRHAHQLPHRAQLPEMSRPERAIGRPLAVRCLPHPFGQLLV